MNPESWFLIGHMVCISQWCAFIMVDYAYLGKGRVRPLWLWTTVLVAGELFLGIKLNIGFFTLLSIWENVGFVLVSTLLFGGTLAQKLTAALQRHHVSAGGKYRPVCGFVGDAYLASDDLETDGLPCGNDHHECHRGRSGGLLCPQMED